MLYIYACIIKTGTCTLSLSRQTLLFACTCMLQVQLDRLMNTVHRHVQSTYMYMYMHVFETCVQHFHSHLHVHVMYCRRSTLGATLIQAPFEACANFLVLIRGAFAEVNYFQAAPILIRTDMVTCSTIYRVKLARCYASNSAVFLYYMDTNLQFGCLAGVRNNQSMATRRALLDGDRHPKSETRTIDLLYSPLTQSLPLNSVGKQQRLCYDETSRTVLIAGLRCRPNLGALLPAR